MTTRKFFHDVPCSNCHETIYSGHDAYIDSKSIIYCKNCALTEKEAKDYGSDQK